MRRAPTIACALVALFAALPAAAVSGQVKDADGKPVEAVRVCQYLPKTFTELMCVGTRADGYYELPDSTRDVVIRIAAPGYFAETVPAKGHSDVVLRKAPTLTVKLVDRESGEPIDSGDVFVIYPSSQKKGPFPVNRAGVRISRILDVGDIRILARADGYSFDGEKSLTLEAGEERTVVIELSPLKD